MEQTRLEELMLERKTLLELKQSLDLVGHPPNRYTMSYGDHNSSVIAHIDMDSFECQVWQREFPQFWHYPCVVADKAGRITSVSYEAKVCGISKSMRVVEAKRTCRTLHVFEKPNVFNKPDTRKLRHASFEVFDVIKEFCDAGKNIIVEFASTDEFYLDVTEEVTRRMQDRSEYPIIIGENIFLEARKRSARNNLRYKLEQVYPTSYLKYHDEERLVYGAAYLTEVTDYLFSQTQFKSSTGIGANKLLAKLATVVNPPGSITVLPQTGLLRLSGSIDLENIPGLAGRLGVEVKEEFQIMTMGELANIDLQQLESAFEPEIAFKLFSWSHGFCDQKVIAKWMKDEINVGKVFPVFLGIRTRADLLLHVGNLSREMHERLEEEIVRHSRKTESLKIQFTYIQRKRNYSKSTTIYISMNDSPNMITQKAYQEICDSGFNETMKITKLSLIARNFISLD